jgi:NADP-dependent 3-hydroxy acid dehydrogenase YdfG
MSVVGALERTPKPEVVVITGASAGLGREMHV